MTESGSTAITAALEGARVAVTGACGSVGAELIRQLRAADVGHIVAVDQNENDLFFLGQAYRDDDRVSVALGDVRNRESLHACFSGCDLVIHAAALKHVPLCEASPMRAVETNIIGTQNVLDSALQAGVETVLFTSTDKAVNPTNVMGTSKLMAERLVTATSTNAGNDLNAFSTRFGNVLGTQGSVIPLFARQIASGGPVTLTSGEMTRFVMTLDQAVTMVLRTVSLGSSGEVFITKMPVARIADLAEVLVEELSTTAPPGAKIEIIETGVRPGEKMYEELMNEEEVRRSYDIGDFLVVEPALKADGASDRGPRADRVYNSATEPCMTTDELAVYLRRTGVLAQYLTGVNP